MAQSGTQQETFDDWLRDHGAILHHVARGFADEPDRSDLMQDLLLAMWKAIPAFRGESLPSTFLFRVAHRTALTWQRTRRNYRRKIDRYRESVAAAAEPRAPSDARAALLERVYDAIRRLPPIDRSLVLMSLDGAGYREMADVHGLSESNVGVRLNRARQKLARATREVPQ